MSTPKTDPLSLDPQPLDHTRSYLNELVGEGKRYDSPEAIARAKVYADDHIKRLETENKQLREDGLRYRDENIAKQKLEDLLDQLQGRKTEKPEEDKQPIVPKENAIDYRQIESLIENKLKQTELTRTYNQNLTTVQQKLKERYGEDYVPHYKQQIDSLDLSKEQADEMARRTPAAFLKMLGIDQARLPQQQFSPPPRSQTNNPQAPATTPPEKRTWAYYENLRKTNKTAYLDSRTQAQMFQDKMQLGDAFDDAGFDPNLGGM